MLYKEPVERANPTDVAEYGAGATADAVTVLNDTEVDVDAPPFTDAVMVEVSATVSVTLIQAIPAELKSDAARLHEPPAVAPDVAEPLTPATVPEPEGVTVTTSPGARVEALPETSLRVTLISEPFAPDFAAVAFCAAKVTVETPVPTLIVKV
jgi:hypothetical protein